MRILGISCMFHDASVTVMEESKILFAGHAERYSRQKNDSYLNQELMADALKHGLPDVIVLHESSTLKNKRRVSQLTWASIKAAFTEITAEEWLKKFYPQLNGIPVTNCLHHESHAGAGVMTSEFDECAVMTIDAIGEYQTATIYYYDSSATPALQLKHETKFPNSLGLFYSAVTHAVGLKPMEDEYVLMGMAAYGNPVYADKINKELFKHAEVTNDNLHECLHTINMSKGLPKNFMSAEALADEQIQFDLAASAQQVCEQRILSYATLAKRYNNSDNLVFMGGCALNCVANSLLYKVFKNLHIMPNPGDAGSSLGAAALYNYYNTLQKAEWEGPYLGYNIEGTWPEKKFLASLREGDIFGVANGKAEFGPRALGNRSLFADPRGETIKDRVNEIKRRQKFRPFAPIVLQEHASDWFDMPGGYDDSPYMQFVAKCKRPDIIPAVVHGDGTSRVQTVNRKQHPELYKALSKWHEESGCPIVLNTSLNIKGQPIVNTIEDAHAFETHYGVKVHISDD
ncbi:carbamoyltransferase C-terminal domain-containing protein [bacterium]|nr:carbamoyltransferase C-terminal domain-containing protein [bacterium]